MDTSDSEGCFESADEDFHSEDESSETNVSSVKKNDNEEKHESLEEYGIPPMISVCWEPGMQFIERDGELVPGFPEPPSSVENGKTGEQQNEETKIKNPTAETEKQTNDNELSSKMDQVNIVDTRNNNTIAEDDTLSNEDVDQNVSQMRNKENKVKKEENTQKDCSSKYDKENENKSKEKTHNQELIKCQQKEVDRAKVSKENEGSNFQENMKKSDDEPSQKDVWNEDDGWGWSEDEGSSENVKQNTNVIEKEHKNDITTEHKQVSSVCSVKKVEPMEDMWKDDDWNENVADDLKTNTSEPLQKEENLWGDDEDWLDNSDAKTPNTTVENNKKQDISKAFENLTSSPSQESSWGGWGNWGISTVLSTAANITNSVSQGITTALETGIGVPDPEELARLHKAEQESSPQPMTTEPPPGLTFGLNNLVSGVSTITKLVESTSTKVISGGLDTLETIGKKTMEVLQENDPGLKKKRAFLKIEQDKPVLSQILREAKEKAEEENKEREKLHYTKKANYETIFDDHQGLVHLEALEMLSKQCEIKLQSVISKTSPDKMADLQETLDQVKELCELLEEDEDEGVNIEDIKEKIDAAVADIKVPISYVKFLDRWSDTEQWLLDLDVEKVVENQVHQYAIETLAELTALSVEQFHKAGELLLVKEHRSTADEADSLVQLTTVLTGLISSAASKFSEKLNSHPSHWGSKEVVNSQITNVFLEAANSSRYIQDAFQLLIPVLQVGAV